MQGLCIKPDWQGHTQAPVQTYIYIQGKRGGYAMWKAIVACLVLAFTSSAALAAVKQPPAEMSAETKECIKCHKKNNPGIVQQWGSSAHYGANVGCYECHAADPKDADAYIHDGKKVKKHIATHYCPVKTLSTDPNVMFSI